MFGETIKTHIRVRIPLALDAALSAAYPAFAGKGKAEARVCAALFDLLSARGVDPGVPRPVSGPAVTGGRRAYRRARAPRVAHARAPRVRRPRVSRAPRAGGHRRRRRR